MTAETNDCKKKYCCRNPSPHHRQRSTSPHKKILSGRSGGNNGRASRHTALDMEQKTAVIGGCVVAALAIITIVLLLLFAWSRKRRRQFHPVDHSELKPTSESYGYYEIVKEEYGIPLCTRKSRGAIISLPPHLCQLQCSGYAERSSVHTDSPETGSNSGYPVELKCPPVCSRKEDSTRTTKERSEKMVGSEEDSIINTGTNN